LSLNRGAISHPAKEADHAADRSSSMSPERRNLALTAHVACSVGWLGAVAGFLALAVAGLGGRDPARHEEPRGDGRTTEYRNAAPVPTATTVSISATWCRNAA
jgi:hypothetical protein